MTLKGFPTGDYTKLYAGKPEYAKANNIGMAVYGWGADWPDGFGFLQQIVDSRVIRPAGNTNLGVKDPAVDALIDQALLTTDADARNKIWGQVDTKVMDDAYVLPGVWASVVLYRGHQPDQRRYQRGSGWLLRLRPAGREEVAVPLSTRFE